MRIISNYFVQIEISTFVIVGYYIIPIFVLANKPLVKTVKSMYNGEEKLNLLTLKPPLIGYFRNFPNDLIQPHTIGKKYLSNWLN